MNADEPAIPADPYGLPDDLDGPGYVLMPLYDALDCIAAAALATDDGDPEKAERALAEATFAALGFEPGSDEADCLDRLIAIVRRAGAEVTP